MSRTVSVSVLVAALALGIAVWRWWPRPPADGSVDRVPAAPLVAGSEPPGSAPPITASSERTTAARATVETAMARIVEAICLLEKADDPASAQEHLDALKGGLFSIDAVIAAEAVIRVLGDRALDAPTQIAFVVGAGGFLDGHPTLRVALLDWLGQSIRRGRAMGRKGFSRRRPSRTSGRWPSGTTPEPAPRAHRGNFEPAPPEVARGDVTFGTYSALGEADLIARAEVVGNGGAPITGGGASYAEPSVTDDVFLQTSLIVMMNTPNSRWELLDAGDPSRKLTSFAPALRRPRQPRCRRGLYRVVQRRPQHGGTRQYHRHHAQWPDHHPRRRIRP